NNGTIKFVFTDDAYLKTKFPNHSAHISDFLGSGHNLKELFIDGNIDNIKNYQVLNGNLIRRVGVKEKFIPNILTRRVENIKIEGKLYINSSKKGKLSDNGHEL
ncbi:MAG: hypothetical protein WC389_16740, partial [Lutibacter sp.]